MLVGRTRIGVRSNSLELHGALRHAFAAHLDDEVEAPPNYSVRLSDEPNAFNFLYWGGTTVVRTLDPGRVVRALMMHLFAHEPPRAGVLRTRALAVERDGQVLLAPAPLCSDLAHLEPLLARRGFAVSDAPWADVDLSSAELLVPAFDGTVDWSRLERVVPARQQQRRSERVVGPGRYPVRAWALLESDGLDRRLPRGEALLHVASLSSHWATPSADAGLSGLASLVARVPLCTMWLGTASATVAALEDVFERGADRDVAPGAVVLAPPG